MDNGSSLKRVFSNNDIVCFAETAAAGQFRTDLTETERKKITHELVTTQGFFGSGPCVLAFEPAGRGITVNYDLKVGSKPLECRIRKIEILEEAQTVERIKRDVGCPSCPNCCDAKGLFLKIGSAVVKLVYIVFLPLLAFAWAIQHLENYIKELGTSLDKLSIERHSRYVQA